MKTPTANKRMTKALQFTLWCKYSINQKLIKDIKRKEELAVQFLPQM
jgi:hypothetical protein